MKFLLSLLFILSTLYAQGQQTELEPIQSKKIQFGIAFSPDLCYRSLSNTGGSQTTSILIKQLNARESPKLGYTSGVKVHIPLKNKAGFQTGILYSNKGYRTKSSIFHWPNQGQSMIRSTSFFYNYHFIDIPAIMKFRLGSGKNHIFFGGGVIGNILIDATQIAIIELMDGSIDKESIFIEQDFNTINLSPTISLGYEYAMGERFILRVEPSFQYSLLSILDSTINERLYNAGMNVTCYLK